GQESGGGGAGSKCKKSPPSECSGACAWRGGINPLQQIAEKTRWDVGGSESSARQLAPASQVFELCLAACAAVHVSLHASMLRRVKTSIQQILELEIEVFLGHRLRRCAMSYSRNFMARCFRARKSRDRTVPT